MNERKSVINYAFNQKLNVIYDYEYRPTTQYIIVTNVIDKLLRSQVF
jgi:hypothetical protein